MKKHLLYPALLTLAFTPILQAEETGTNTQMNTVQKDSDFPQKAAMSGMTDMKLSKAAVEKAQNPAVKSYAQMMVSDHEKANANLMALAAKNDIKLPTELDKGDMEACAKVEAMEGADFDKAYMKKMVKNHRKSVALFQSASTSAGDPEVVGFAKSTLPTLEQHLAEAEKIEKDLNSGS